MYADNITGSIERAINETVRRRKIQETYNEEHGITPQGIKKAIKDIAAGMSPVVAERGEAYSASTSLRERSPLCIP